MSKLTYFGIKELGEKSMLEFRISTVKGRINGHRVKSHGLDIVDTVIFSDQ